MSYSTSIYFFIARLFRSLPSFKGKLRLSRLLIPKKIFNSERIDITGKYNCHYQLPNLIDSIGWELFINGVYEINTIQFIVDHVRPNGIIIDIGSNIGAISIPVSKLRKDVFIYSIEASKFMFEILLNNIELNGINNIKPIQIAIADQSSNDVSFYSPKQQFGKGSFSPVFTKEAEKVTAISIDQWLIEEQIKTVDLIKIDIEGFEYLAFKGGAKLFNAENAPDIIFEFVDWAEAQAQICAVGGAQQILLSYGYHLFSIDKKNKFFPVNEVMFKGASMLFATKSKLF